MGGGLITIISYGSKDLYLTGAPEITFFKIAYRRHTNFSMESMEINFLSALNFGDSVDITIPRYGDLIHKMYLEINLPSFSFNMADIGLTPAPSYDPTPETNYNIVLAFMAINTQAFRVAYQDYQALNVDVNTMLQDVLNVFASAPSATINQYETLFSTGVSQGKISLAQDTNLLSNANNFLNESLANPFSIGKDDVMNKFDTLIQNSIAVQNIYFNLYQSATNQYQVNSSGALNFAWVKRLGHAIIDYVEVTIGGQTIDKQCGDWLNVFYELTGNRHLDPIYSVMIGDVPAMTNFDSTPSPAYKLIIPLQFWFNRVNGLAFPLIAMEYNDIVVTVKLKQLHQCLYVQYVQGFDVISIEDIWDDKGLAISGDFLIDYIFLDAKERQKFAQSAHEYLIEATQYITSTINTNTTQIKLTFNHPCKELIIISRKDAYINNDNGFTKIDWTNYGTNNFNGKGLLLNYAQLLFNGYDRITQAVGTAQYLNYAQPYEYHRNTPADGINVYSFAINPEEHQPSGTCNFSRILNALLTLNYNTNAFTYYLSEIYNYITPGSQQDTLQSTNVDITVFATNYNVLRLIGGFGGLGFTF